MTDYREVGQCRVCNGGLESVLDLGVQNLGGQFPAVGEQDPPAVPLRLMRCVGCGLAQLAHTVAPELMFRSYGYRSGVTETMRGHLHRLADEAWWMLPERHLDARVLDIGGNDGTLLVHIPLPAANKYLIDPSDVPPMNGRGHSVRQKGFFPQDMPADWTNFNLIFTVACFYDADDPVAFAQVVADRLAPNGIWCVEVADATRMALECSWDAICHEHLCYYEAATFQEVCRRAGLTIVNWDRNDCNGGSFRFYAARNPKSPPGFQMTLIRSASEWADFALAVERSRNEIADFLFKSKPGKVHLLGASTKANTWLQAVGANASVIQAASERDRRKVGRRTPGTGVPIVSEDESRQMRPDVYVCGPWHFEKEIIDREYVHLARGGRLVFPLPRLHEKRLEA